MADRGILVSFLDRVKTLKPDLRPAQSRIQRIKEAHSLWTEAVGAWSRLYIYIRRIPRLKKERTCTDSRLYTLMTCTALVLPSPYLDLDLYICLESTANIIRRTKCPVATTDWVLAPIYIYNKVWAVFLTTVRTIVLTACNAPTEPAVGVQAAVVRTKRVQ